MGWGAIWRRECGNQGYPTKSRPDVGMFALRNAKKCGFWRGAPGAHTSALHLPAKVFLDTRMTVFEMHNAKKCRFLAWFPKGAYLCTKSASKSGFGYLGWGRLKWRISNTPLLGVQNHSFRQIWCRSMRAWSAAPKPPHFLICAFQTPPY